MATKNKPGAFDCYANAEPDEPMFVLLARDELAPHLTRAWVAARKGELGSAIDAIERAVYLGSRKNRPSVAKMAEAYLCAENMEQYNEGLKWAAECDAARLWKVIDVDNLARDYETEYLIDGTEGLSKEQAEQVAAYLNERFGGEFASRYYKAVHNERKLYVLEGY